MLENLLSEEPNRNSRHVVIAVSGFLTQDTEKTEHWANLINYVKDSKSSLFVY